MEGFEWRGCQRVKPPPITGCLISQSLSNCSSPGRAVTTAYCCSDRGSQACSCINIGGLPSDCATGPAESINCSEAAAERPLFGLLYLIFGTCCCTNTASKRLCYFVNQSQITDCCKHTAQPTKAAEKRQVTLICCSKRAWASYSCFNWNLSLC